MVHTNWRLQHCFKLKYQIEVNLYYSTNSFLPFSPLKWKTTDKLKHDLQLYKKNLILIWFSKRFLILKRHVASTMWDIFLFWMNLLVVVKLIYTFQFWNIINNEDDKFKVFSLGHNLLTYHCKNFFASFIYLFIQCEAPRVRIPKLNKRVNSLERLKKVESFLTK